MKRKMSRRARAALREIDREQAKYDGEFPLTVERIDTFLSRHRISVHIGRVVVPKAAADPRWFAFLTDQTSAAGDRLYTRKPTGYGETPDGALCDLFRRVSGRTIHFDYDFGRAKLRVLVPSFTEKSA